MKFKSVAALSGAIAMTLVSATAAFASCRADAEMRGNGTRPGWGLFAGDVRSRDCDNTECTGYVEYEVSVQWGDGRITHETFSDSYIIPRGNSSVHISNEHTFGSHSGNSSIADVGVKFVRCN